MKLLSYIFTILYFIAPFDLIPDFLGVFGRIDDILLIYAVYIYYKKLKERKDTFYRQHLKSDEQRKEVKSSDPYEILELEKSATKEEVNRQYRKLLALYHPDKVSHLGEELKKLAMEKTISIKEAYEKIKK